MNHSSTSHETLLVTATATRPLKKPSRRRRHKHKPGNEQLCKYASKACYQPRVVKKTGELHRYCDHHRLQANRNQRRLEQRRRLKERVETGNMRSPASSSSYSVLSYSSDDSDTNGTVDDKSEATRVGEELCSVIFEPFLQPVALRDEDLSSLQCIFTEPADGSGPSRIESAAMYGIFFLSSPG